MYLIITSELSLQNFLQIYIRWHYNMHTNIVCVCVCMQLCACISCHVLVCEYAYMPTQVLIILELCILLCFSFEKCFTFWCISKKLVCPTSEYICARLTSSRHSTQINRLPTAWLSTHGLAVYPRFGCLPMAWLCLPLARLGSVYPRLSFLSGHCCQGKGHMTHSLQSPTCPVMGYFMCTTCTPYILFCAQPAHLTSCFS